MIRHVMSTMDGGRLKYRKGGGKLHMMTITLTVWSQMAIKCNLTILVIEGLCII